MMFENRNHIIMRWLVLLFVGTSISFTTLHSHHDIEWDHSTKHAGSHHCLTENTNLCPINGYLFNASVVDESPQFELKKLPISLAQRSESQRLDPFSGEPAGRSPPVIG